MALNTQPHSTEDHEVQDLGFANQASETPMHSIESEILPGAAIEEAQNVRIVSDDQVESSVAAKENIPFEDRTMDRVDATLVGSSMDSGRNVRLPLIGHLPIQKQIRYLLIAMSVSLVLSAFFVWLNSSQSALISTQAQISGEILMHSQRIGKAAPNAIYGKPAAFSQLDESQKAINANLNVLINGGDYKGRTISKPSATLEPVLVATKRAWSNSDRAATVVLKTKKELAGFREDLENMNLLSPTLASLSDEISTQKVQSGAAAQAIFASGQLVMLTQRLARSASEFMTPEGINPEKAFLLGKDANTFFELIEGFLNGSEINKLAATKEPATRAKLAELQKVFVEYRKHVDNILAKNNDFIEAKKSEQLIFNENEELKQKISTLEKTYTAQQDSTNLSFWFLMLTAVLALIAATGIAIVLLQDSRNRTKEANQRRLEADAQMQLAQKQEEQANAVNEQNQAAILRLMNELQEVADGDLTVQATVSEDITGAIADSVNYTVEELRGLVGRVTNTAVQVTSASSQAQTISDELLEASHQQAREIVDAGKAITTMANDITEVSRSANESAEVARQSVAAAEQGALAVENTIKGMNEIREQIQETSKRIKRLGESSQEIGEITELISDITEQTNVLALNAAIQAASAGEAGRGFSVVAEEVQRLAERSAEATKQIGALVRTIQTDTHDAVAAMEKSTQGVVEGAKLSDAAGTALSEIRSVSNRLAELIQGISLSTEQQATSANGVAQNIEHILTITEKTQNGTQQTSLSIKDLSKLAEELKNSVSRFRVTA
jgi:twitching motility protein PilJ